MRRLAEAGLTTREACGNSVRNITACPYAGVAADEPFDVTPYAEALTRYLLRHPLSARLPRKFKIAFEGCTHDHIGTAINDIGWTARVRTVDGAAQRGFRVTVAGGTATLVRSGQELFDFVPVGEMLNIAEAIVRVFHKLGDYKHKQRNRLKFLVRSLGWDAFKAEFDKELRGVPRRRGARRLPFEPDAAAGRRRARRRAADAPAAAEITAAVAAGKVSGPGIVPQVGPEIGREEFDYWSRTNVRPQKQPGSRDGHGHHRARRPDLGADADARRASPAPSPTAPCGSPSDQNVVLRWVPEPARARRCTSGCRPPGCRAPAPPRSPTSRAARAPSRASWRSRSRAGSAACSSDTLDTRPDLVAAVPGLDIKISGCPNGCGQHHIAGIGFQGSLRKVGGRPAPHYFVMIGGGVGRRRHDLRPARRRRCPPAGARWRSSGSSSSIAPKGRPPKRRWRSSAASSCPRSRRCSSDLEKLTPEAASDTDFIDLAEDHAFNPEVMDGECSA